MNNFMEYFKQNKKRIFNMVMLSIIPIYIILTLLFPLIFIDISRNTIVQIVIISSVLYFIINIKKIKISKDRIKELFKNYKEFINKYILVKAITILIVITITSNIFNLILNQQK